VGNAGNRLVAGYLLDVVLVFLGQLPIMLGTAVSCVNEVRGAGFSG
jgi:hypothetical protein